MNKLILCADAYILNAFSMVMFNFTLRPETHTTSVFSRGSSRLKKRKLKKKPVLDILTQKKLEQEKIKIIKDIIKRGKKGQKTERQTYR